MKRSTNIISGILFIILLIPCSCKNESDEFGKDDAIPYNELINILTDLYIADGLLNHNPIRSVYSEKDTTENYHDVIAKFGYSKYDVDESINYYFVEHPKKLEEIYDKVIENLSSLEADVMQTQFGANINKNLWNGERTYNLPDHGLENPVEFNTELRGPGTYILTARYTVHKDDQSIDPHILIWFWYDDGSEEGNITYWEKTVLEKTSKSKVISLTATLNDPKVTHLRGRLFNHTDQTGHWEKHAHITNITIIQKPLEEESPPIQ